MPEGGQKRYFCIRNLYEIRKSCLNIPGNNNSRDIGNGYNFL